MDLTITYIPVLVSPVQVPVHSAYLPSGRGGRSATSRASRAAGPRFPPGSPGLSWVPRGNGMLPLPTAGPPFVLPPGSLRVTATKVANTEGARVRKGLCAVLQRALVSQTLRRPQEIRPHSRLSNSSEAPGSRQKHANAPCDGHLQAI